METTHQKKAGNSDIACSTAKGWNQSVYEERTFEFKDGLPLLTLPVKWVNCVRRYVLYTIALPPQQLIEL